MNLPSSFSLKEDVMVLFVPFPDTSGDHQPQNSSSPFASGNGGCGCEHTEAANGASSPGSRAENISQGTSVKPRVEDTSTVLWLGSATSQAAEKMCGGDNQMPCRAGHIFWAKGLERRLLCFTRFLRVSC